MQCYVLYCAVMYCSVLYHRCWMLMCFFDLVNVVMKSSYLII